MLEQLALKITCGFHSLLFDQKMGGKQQKKHGRLKGDSLM